MMTLHMLCEKHNVIKRFSEGKKRNSWVGLFKARLSYPWINENFDLSFTMLQ